MARKIALRTSLALLALCAAPRVQAQESAPRQPAAAPTAGDAADEGLGAIIVTAQRRAEDVQRAALAITAVTGEELQQRSVTQTEQLAGLSASLQVSTSAGPYASFSVRSVNSLSGNAFADPAVAVNLNGVYLATPTVLHGLYFDLDRVEILKGPQGTLYGRNATAGAINIIPARPRMRNEGRVNAEVGNLGRLNFGAALNLALADSAALRIAGQRVRRNGYMSDGTSDDSGEAVRATLLLEPSPNVSIMLSADYAHQGGRGPGATIRKRCELVGGPAGEACFVADPYTGIADLGSLYTAAGQALPTRNQYIDGDYWGLAINADVTTGIGTVSFVGGYRASDNTYVGTGTSWQLRERQKPEQVSAELRLASGGDGPLQYIVGLYYLDTSMSARAQSENATRRLFSDSFTELTGWTWAGFGQVTYAVTPALRIVGGARYTYEKKSSDSFRYTLANTVGPDPVIPPGPTGNPNLSVVGSRSWDRINWKAGVEFDAADRSLIYANVSTGFKAGGFFYGPPAAQSYNPEVVTSFVLGSKNRFAGNRLQLNAEAFYLDYRDQQVSFVKLVGNSAVLVTENAGKSTAYGIELESEYLATEQTRLGLQVQWLKAEYDQFSYNTIAPPGATTLCKVTPGFTVDCSGLTAIRSPEWTINASAEQGFELADGGRIVGDTRARYQSSFYADTSYQIETKANATVRLDLGLGYTAPDDAWTVRAFVNNVTDVVTISNATVNTSYATNGIVGVNLLAPRTWGVQASAKF
ncbi:MAG: TonB-dependent receptor [Croceibacterium sp.]